jgi:fucose permease
MICAIFGGAVISIMSTFINDNALSWAFVLTIAPSWGLLCSYLELP